MALAYTRALLKISGEALAGDKSLGLDYHMVEAFAEEIKAVHALGVHLALVVGGGNIIRGTAASREGLDRERRIAEEQVAKDGKPENIRGKIVDGKLKKFVAERTLTEQPFVKDDSKTVGQLLKEASGKLGEAISVRRFARFKIGEA